MATPVPIWLGKDNRLVVTLTTADGSPYNLALLTKATLTLGSISINSVDNASLFDVTGSVGAGKILIQPGLANFVPGIYNKGIFETVDVDNPEGIVWSDSLSFEVRQL